MTNELAASAGSDRSRFGIWIASVTAAIAVATDQLTKWWVLQNLAEGERRPLLGDFFSLKLIHNPGAAFSFGEGITWIFSLLSLIVVLAIAYWVASGRVQDRFLAFLLGLIGGGAIGNLIDRLTRPPGIGRGHVVDFLNYNDWFVGNVADIWIVGGAALLVIYLVFNGDALTPTTEIAEDSHARQ